MTKAFRISIIAFFALLLFFCAGISAQAAEYWDGVKGDGIVSLDTKVKYEGADYSIKVQNSGYFFTYAYKTVKVEPNSCYKVSVMVKMQDYELKASAAEGTKSGASVGLVDKWPESGYVSDNSWKKLSFEFNSGDESSYNIALMNGIWAGDCKGTAYFSDFKIEKIEVKWDAKKGYAGAFSAEVDRKVKYGSNEYSIKITNNDYGCSYVSKTFDVKPNTYYRATVMAKMTGYELKSGARASGASIGQKDKYSESGYVKEDTWKKLSFEFDSGDSTTYDIALWNGMYAGDCKGTVFFSGFKLEEVDEPDYKVKTLYKTGEDKDSIVFVIVGDGFTASQQQSFEEHAKELADHLLSIKPFSTEKKHINIYCIDVVSAVSGASSNPDKPKNTAFGCCYNVGGIARLMVQMKSNSQTVLKRLLKRYYPECDYPLMIVNTPNVYGGGATKYVSVASIGAG